MTERPTNSSEHLRTLEKRFHQLAENNVIGLLIGDLDGGVSYLNQTLLKLLEFTEQEVAAGLVRWDRITPPEYAAADAEAIRQLHESGRCELFEKEYLTKSGCRVWVVIGASRLETVHGRTEVAAFILDVTERKRSEQRDSFLVKLDDATRNLSEPEAILETALRMLGEYLRVDRCGYCVFEEDEEAFQLVWNYVVPGMASMVGRYSLDSFGPAAANAFRENRFLIAKDIELGDEPEDSKAMFRATGIRAHLSVPLHKGGRLVAAIGVHQATPRDWLPGEAEIVNSVANRCWESIERTRVTLALKNSEQNLRMAQKAGRIGSFDWLVAQNRITWSPELETLYGLTEGGFEGRIEGWSSRLEPEDAARVMKGIEDCMRRLEPEYDYEFRAVLPDGRCRWLRGQAQFFYSADGKPERMIGVNIDIHEQKQAEAHLKQQWLTFDTALSHMPDMVYIFDLQGKFTYANQALLSLLGVEQAEIAGKTFLELKYPPQLAEKLESQIQEVIRCRQPLRDVTPFAGATGEMRHYEYIFVPVISSMGEVEAVSGSTRDITERLQLEEQNREREEQIRESARLESLGVMAGGVAHDFNNLLTGILGNACLLTELCGPEARDVAQQIVLGSERAADLTRQMLAFSGKGKFVTETMDLNALVQENLTLLRASLSRSVIVDLDLGHQQCVVDADRTQMQQIVMNLIINASEAIGDRPGRVIVRTGLTQRTVSQFSPFLQASIPAGRYVLLEVQDDGSGMTPETLRHIFDPFFTTKFTGRGLGLAAVLGIVRGHRGDVDVITQPGQGTCFRILLPAADNPAIPQTQAAPVKSNTSAGKTVLVVDDEEIVRKIAATALTRRGFHVITAANGAEALEVLQLHPETAVVLLDLTMPVMTGEQALPRIKALNPLLPVVLSSGFNEAEISTRFRLEGASGFLQKPYTISAIVGKVVDAIAAAPPAE